MNTYLCTYIIHVADKMLHIHVYHPLCLPREVRTLLQRLRGRKKIVYAISGPYHRK